ncbi:hypothetical protein GALL_451100 [mine drainage metagenome]|uniref:Uncharacterized protein n=1 Tax=mine drainage metagenome TaxID=410659 RepID=A0A1J5QBB1_9ZZZZ
MATVEFGLEALYDLFDVFAAVFRGAWHLLQAKGPKRRGQAATDAALADQRKFHGRAANVTDDAFGLGPAQ